MNKLLQAELLSMAEEDLRVREELVATGELFDGYDARMAAVHEKNAAELQRIIEENGWPGTAMVGGDGAEAAWLILQHAIGNPELQRQCLPLLQNAAEAGEIPAYQAASLEDRICAFEGRPQRYGTQFDWDGSGAMNPHPIQDPVRVDSLRESVGLGPLSEKIKEMQRNAVQEGQEQPRDFEAYQRKRDAWARSVGWRRTIKCDKR